MQKNDAHLPNGRIKLFMFVLVLCLLTGHVQAAADEPYKHAKVNLKANNMELVQVLDILGEMSKVQFFYNHSQIDVHRKITLNMISCPLDEVLEQIFKGQPVEIEYRKERVIVLTVRSALPQDEKARKISGAVVDDVTGDVLPGASVVLKENRAMGVVTGIDGKFTLEVPSSVTALIISFIGYETYELPLKGKLTDLKVRLKLNVVAMEDVVVTGMLPRKVEGFTGEYVTVKGEKLRQLSPNNLLSALQIFDPSFRIVENNQRGSDPNAMPEFRLRGDVQLGSAAIDDMTMLLGDYSNRPNMPLFILDGFETTLQQIVDLDPERVESITILKDAAATAIYGSRAANGVVVFETQQPKTGHLQVSYNTNVGITIPDLRDYNLMNADEKLEFEMQSGAFHPKNATEMNYYNHYKREILKGVNTYWLSSPLRSIATHRHNLNLSGGDQVLRYSLGVNYNSNPGVMKGSDRTTVGLNFRIQYRKKNWNIGNSLNISEVLGNGTPYGSFSDYTKLNPYYCKTDAQGNYLSIIENKVLAGKANMMKNPLYNTQFAFKDYTENFNVTDNLSVEWTALPNMRLSANASFTKGTAKTEKFKSMNHTDFVMAKDLLQKGTYDKRVGESFSWNANVSFSYNPSVEKHTFNIFGRWEARESESNSLSLAARGFPNDKMNDFLFGYTMSRRVAGSEATSRSIGITGQFNYMYDFRYAVDFSIRGDLSSKFGAETPMAPFWSVGVRWNIHREKWLQHSVVSNWALRGSLGVTGSQNYAPYQAIEMYSFSGLMVPYPSGDVLGAELKGIGNPDLGWSKTLARSVSMEIGLWENRVSGSFTYYNNYTDQLLLTYTLAPSVGFLGMVANVGAVGNEGYDFQLSFMPINNYKSRIQWNIAINGTHNRNVIRKVSNFLAQMNKENLEKKTSTPTPVYEEGKSTTQFFTVPSLGLDPATGEEIFLKRNGEKTFKWDPADKVAVGDALPALNGSVSSSFTYKGWSANVVFSYEFGAYTYNQTLVDKIENVSLINNVDRRAAKDRWSPENRYAKYKKVKLDGYATLNSSRFVQKRDELKFTSITMGYRFDARSFHFLQQCRISSLNLNFSMQDIARLSTVKQERGLGYPFAQNFNLSLSVLFN